MSNDPPSASNDLMINEKRILLMGLRRGGKSSIRQVIFHDMQPIETLYLESTTKPISEKLNSLTNFVIEEIPGQMDISTSEPEMESLFREASTVIYVIDSQDEYLLSLQNVILVISAGIKYNPQIHFEILIHKVDGLSEDYRLETKRDIIERINDDLVDIGAYDADITFHTTSIFDQSLIEAFSRIIQKLVPELNSLTQLLDMFCGFTGMDKAFLFDVNSKLYLATDSSPVDTEIHKVCSAFIDVTVKLNGLYKGNRKSCEFSYSKLENNSAIILAEMIKGTILVGISSEISDNQLTLIEYNSQVFRDGIIKMYRNSA